MRIESAEENIFFNSIKEQNQGTFRGRIVRILTADQLREWGHRISTFWIAMSWVVIADGMGLFLPALPVSVLLTPIVIGSGAAMNIAGSAVEKRLSRNVNQLRTDEKVEKYYQIAFMLHAVALVGFIIISCISCSADKVELSQSDCRVFPFMAVVCLSCMAWLGMMENGIFPVHNRARIRLLELFN